MTGGAGANVRVLKDRNSEGGWDTNTIRSAAFAFGSVALLALVLVAATLTGYHDVLEQQTKSSSSHQVWVFVFFVCILGMRMCVSVYACICVYVWMCGIKYRCF
jgi:hypothetical protein